jgi:hypothetical protein
MPMPGRLESPHVVLPPSGWLVRDFAVIVQISALPILDSRQDFAVSNAIGSKFVGHDGSRHVAQTLRQFAEEALGGLRITSALSQYIEYVAMLIKRLPEVVQIPLDADENLVQKPFVTGF